VPALQTISGNNGGYLLVTGSISTDNRFLLQKYFLQILAGISNADIVLDPDGQLVPGQVTRVPFELTSGDSGVDVILLTPDTRTVDFRLQTPSGRIIEPWRAMSEPGMRFVLSAGVSYYRIALPTELLPNRFDGGGTWYALLEIGRPRLKRSDTPNGTDTSILQGMLAPPVRSRAKPLRGAQAQRASILAFDQIAAATASVSGQATFNATSSQRMLPYSLVVHAYSNVSLGAHVEQTHFEPGASASLSATLTQSGLPMNQPAQIWANVTRPDGSTISVTLAKRHDGKYSENFVMPTSGVYRFRIRARGTTYRGESFTREKTLTAAVWRGGNSSGGNGGVGGTGGTATASTLCALLKCLFERDGLVSVDLEKRLRALGIDIAAARTCIALHCEGKCDCK
jgi:hypothetical protein